MYYEPASSYVESTLTEDEKATDPVANPETNGGKIQAIIKRLRLINGSVVHVIPGHAAELENP